MADKLYGNVVAKFPRPEVKVDDLVDLLLFKGVISDEDVAAIAYTFAGGIVHMQDRMRHRFDPAAKAQAEDQVEDVNENDAQLAGAATKAAGVKSEPPVAEAPKPPVNVDEVPSAAAAKPAGAESAKAKV